MFVCVASGCYLPIRCWNVTRLGITPPSSISARNSDPFTRFSFSRWIWIFKSYSLINVLTLILSIYKFGLSVCLFVCLYPINVKTAEPIGPKFFVGSRVTPQKVYGWSNFQKFASNLEPFWNLLICCFSPSCLCSWSGGRLYL